MTQRTETRIKQTIDILKQQGKKQIYPSAISNKMINITPKEITAILRQREDVRKVRSTDNLRGSVWEFTDQQNL